MAAGFAVPSRCHAESTASSPAGACTQKAAACVETSGAEVHLTNVEVYLVSCALMLFPALALCQQPAPGDPPEPGTIQRSESADSSPVESKRIFGRSEEHTSELQSPVHLVC